MARRLGQGCGSWNACGGEAGRKALQSTRASASAERAPVGEKAPEGERAAEAESAAEAERAPEGETAPEGERAPEGEKDMARLKGKKSNAEVLPCYNVKCTGDVKKCSCGACAVVQVPAPSAVPGTDSVEGARRK